VTNTGARWWAWCAAASVLTADLGSKAWASQYVSEGPGPAAIGGLVRLRRVSNPGASFGLGDLHPFVVTALAVLGTAGVAWWLTRTMTAGERIAVGVVLGGAMGNLLDRVAQGAVTDWMQVAWYPAAFNLADFCIRGGIVAALTLRLLHSRSSGQEATTEGRRAGLRRQRVPVDGHRGGTGVHGGQHHPPDDHEQ